MERIFQTRSIWRNTATVSSPDMDPQMTHPHSETSHAQSQKGLMRRAASFIKTSLFWLSIVCFIAAVILTFLPHSSTFDVSATTEAIEYVTSPNHSNIWFLTSAQIGTDGKAFPALFTGRVVIGPKATVHIERISGGSLNVTIAAPDGTNQAPASFEADDGQTVGQVGRRANILVGDVTKRAGSGHSLVLPISGEPKIGNSVDAPVSDSYPLIRQGQIQVLGHNLFGSDLYKGATQALEPNDVLLFEESRGPALGVITVDERPTMTVTFRVIAKEATISRLPAQGYTVGLTLLDRLQKDGTIQSVWGAFIFLFGLRKLGESDEK